MSCLNEVLNGALRKFLWRPTVSPDRPVTIDALVLDWPRHDSGLYGIIFIRYKGWEYKPFFEGLVLGKNTFSIKFRHMPVRDSATRNFSLLVPPILELELGLSKLTDEVIKREQTGHQWGPADVVPAWVYTLVSGGGVVSILGSYFSIGVFATLSQYVSRRDLWTLADALCLCNCRSETKPDWGVTRVESGCLVL
ncbi:hypothetical protein [Halegenticoccus soli]|uniref:hypothetical protein n=1 Tax=Halegenticoccus soli TaxID=1985678 RepID=UPI0013043C12|nr:hypothetical protein [Halegenticoccus soli]